MESESKVEYRRRYIRQSEDYLEKNSEFELGLWVGMVMQNNGRKERKRVS